MGRIAVITPELIGRRGPLSTYPPCFRGVSRGIKDTFTRQRSKEDYEEGKKIGTGFATMGKGVGGVGRGVGHEVKEGLTKDEGPAQDEDE